MEGALNLSLEFLENGEEVDLFDRIGPEVFDWSVKRSTQGFRSRFDLLLCLLLFVASKNEPHIFCNEMSIIMYHKQISAILTEIHCNSNFQ